MSKKLWARIGMSCEISDTEHETLKKLMIEKPGDAASMLYELFAEKGDREGDSYLIANCDDNPNICNDFDF